MIDKIFRGLKYLSPKQNLHHVNCVILINYMSFFASVCTQAVPNLHVSQTSLFVLRAGAQTARMLRFLSNISLKMVKLDNKYLINRQLIVCSMDWILLVVLCILTRQNTARLVTISSHTTYKTV